jgi:hypothetical protein
MTTSKTTTNPIATKLADAKNAVRLHRAAVKASIERVKELRAEAAAVRADTKQQREAAKAAKAQATATKREAAIIRAQERLAKLLAKQNPVGIKARKANQKPGAVKITKFQEDARVANELSMKIAAKRQSA